jgi:DNA-binding CsgD family transcriptional regulator
MARNAGLGGLGIYAKLGVGDRAAAVAQVLRRGLIH